MSHQVLARKWRPQTFEQLVGQQHVLQALTNALERGRLHHAYLLTGTRGVGKTTIARILARCFNCETGVTSTPCGVCSACTEITEGRCIDLIEVDAASRTKVEDTREILDNVQFAPTNARYKVYLIDEVHMLSNSSFNALLKTLEEPPPHVIFLLATTHPQKIPPTVLSRCLQFHLKNLPVETIVSHLTTIFKQENIESEEQALFQIAYAAAGSMRDALSLAEQAIAFGAGKVSYDQVKEMLGLVDHQIVVNLFNSIVDGYSEKALALIDEFSQQATDYSQLVDELLGLLHRIAVEQVVPNAGAEGQFYNDVIVQGAKKLLPEDVQLYYQTLLNAKRDLALAPNPLSGLQMLVLRLLAFQRLTTEDERFTLEAIDEPVSGVSENEKKYLTEKDPGPSGSSPISIENDVQDKIEIEHVDDVQSNSLKTQDHKAFSSEQSATSTLQNYTLTDLTPELWCEIFSALPLTGVVRAISAHCWFVNIINDTTVQLNLSETNALLYKSDYQEKLASGLSIYFATQVTVKIEVVSESDTVETPSQYKERQQALQKKAAEKAISHDENVRSIVETFDAEIDMESIVPSQ